MEKTKHKQISDTIYEAIRNWDYNPMTKKFANELSTEILKLLK